MLQGWGKEGGFCDGSICFPATFLLSLPLLPEWCWKVVRCFHRIYFQSSVVVVVRLGFFIICNASGRLSIVTNRETGSLFTQDPISEIKTTNLAAADMQTLSSTQLPCEYSYKKATIKEMECLSIIADVNRLCWEPSSFLEQAAAGIKSGLRPKCLPIRFQRQNRQQKKQYVPWPLSSTN